GLRPPSWAAIRPKSRAGRAPSWSRIRRESGCFSARVSDGREPAKRVKHLVLSRGGRMAEATGPQLVPVAIEDEMRQAYLDYSMSVIVGRALPDVRDGLKPVHRRILYAMFDQGMLHNKRYSKSAGTVGEVLKKYHPHGDASVYDALVRLAQDWNMRAPLIDGQGNFGSIDGDPAAAYRYTEARLTRLAEMMLADIDKETVDFGPNFDDSTTEPLVLPAPFTTRAAASCACAPGWRSRPTSGPSASASWSPRCPTR